MNHLPPSLGVGTVVDLPAPAVQPWERQPRETDTAWALFQAYRDSAYPQGPGEGYVVRSMSTFARAGGWDLQQIKRIAQSHDWNNRALQYDRLIDSHKTEAQIATFPQVVEDHKRILTDLRRLLIVEVGKWLAICEERSEPQVKLREIKTLIDIGIKLDRLTFGESTEIVKLDGAWDISGCSLDQLQALKEIAEKSGGKIEGA